jgi:DNA helicase HerA-like ATPase
VGIADIITDIGNLINLSASDVWNYVTRVLTAGTNLNDITADSVWAVGTRTLTSFGSLISDIWSFITRTLTAGTKDSEIEEIKERTGNLPDDPADASVVAVGQSVILSSISTHDTDIKAAISNLATANDAAMLKALMGKNNKLFDTDYDIQGNLTSGTLRGFLSAADLEADDGGHIFELSISGEYSGLGKADIHIRKDST